MSYLIKHNHTGLILKMSGQSTYNAKMFTFICFIK